MSEPSSSETETGQPGRSQKRFSGHVIARALFGAALIVVGAGAGGLTVNALQRPVAMAPLEPTPINALQDWSDVAIKGKVVEIFGNKYVVEDSTARALVETGRQGEDQQLANKDDVITVQGRFEHGFLHAEYMVTVYGKTIALGPHPGPHEWLHHYLK